MTWLCRTLVVVWLSAGVSACARSAPIVLNMNSTGGDSSAPNDPSMLAGRLRRAANRLVAEFVDGKRVDYAGLGASQAFSQYRALTQELPSFDLGTLDTPPKQLEFWINLYNALVMDAVLASDVQSSVREKSHFFDQYAYDVGGHVFTPNDIEHGVLRRTAFDEHDPRAAFALASVDPRIHFALNCASAGCPPIASYHADRIEEELDLATRAFVNSGSEVHVDVEKRIVHLSRIFDWYAADFGTDKNAALLFVAKYMNDGAARAFLADHVGSVAVLYNEYDWSLNH